MHGVNAICEPKNSQLNMEFKTMSFIPGSYKLKINELLKKLDFPTTGIVF